MAKERVKLPDEVPASDATHILRLWATSDGKYGVNYYYGSIDTARNALAVAKMVGYAWGACLFTKDGREIEREDFK